MLNEADIVKVVAAASKGFIGDDAAVLPAIPDKQYVITKDLLIEDVHFRTSYFTPYHLAHKALQVNLSDLAAMAAKPCYIMCGIAIPKDLELYGKDFINQLVTVCNNKNIILIGGDTTASPDKLIISITAIGEASIANIKYRYLAKNEEYICVAGNLGFAHLGWQALECNYTVAQELTDACLLPNARIKEGEWLGKKVNVSSMMDISDGLFIDLKRLCESSNIDAEVMLDSFAFSNEYLNACLKLKLEPLKVALTGGEDYGLLFTVSKTAYHEFAKEFLDKFNYEIKIIGQTTLKKDVTFIANKDNKQRINLSLTPFTHFAEDI